MPEEEWTKPCEQYGEHQNRVPAGDALLVDLRRDEPGFKSVSKDYEPLEADSYAWSVAARTTTKLGADG